MTMAARSGPWPRARRSDAHGDERRRTARRRSVALVLVVAAFVVALLPVPGVDARAAAGVLLVLAAISLGQLIADATRAR